MPIEQAEYYQGTPVALFETRILDFLTKNRGRAFKPAEIASHLLPVKPDDKWDETANKAAMLAVTIVVLDNLLQQAKISGRQKDGHVYYMLS